VQGPSAFVARCDELAERYSSKRLRPPEALRRIAADGGTIYGTNWQGRGSTDLACPSGQSERP